MTNAYILGVFFVNWIGLITPNFDHRPVCPLTQAVDWPMLLSLECLASGFTSHGIVNQDLALLYVRIIRHACKHTCANARWHRMESTLKLMMHQFYVFFFLCWKLRSILSAKKCMVKLQTLQRWNIRTCPALPMHRIAAGL